MNPSINTSIIETIIKTTHVFNNIWIVSKLRIVKVFSKFDIAIIWINIWDVKNSSSAKMLINRSFNIGSYIIIICEVNMNSGIFQYKNYWK